MALIEIENVSFEYANAPQAALRGINLTIEAGERVALIGANGSGKSTLARLLNALYIPSAGRILIEGLDTRDLKQHRAIRQTVGMVFQNPEDQIVAALVEEDAAFGLENLGLPSVEIRRKVDQILQAFDLWAHRQRPPFMLSSGQMQRLALAGVLVVEPRVVIFDETTAMLDPAGRRTVLDWMADLHQHGVTLLTITHFMGEAARADRVIVLERGQVALDGAPAAVFSDAARLDQLGLHLPPAAALAGLLRPYLPGLPAGILNTSDLLEALPDFAPLVPGGVGAGPSANPAGYQISGVGGTSAASPASLIAVEALCYTYLRGTPLAHRALDGTDLLVAPQTLQGLAGATGSGKSTLLQHLNGLLLPQEGRVTVGPHRLHEPKPDLPAVRRLAGLAFQNPEVQIFETFVGDEIAFGPRRAGLERPAVRESVQWAMQQVGLDFGLFKDRRTMALSGGERKKVALASILARRPEILLLDEPMAGLDPRSRHELLAALRQLAGLGLTVVVSSHQMDDLAGLVSAAAIMAHGRTIFSGPVGSVFEREDELMEAGLEAPVAARAALELRKRGWPLPAGLVTPEALEEALKICVTSHG